MAKPNSEKQKLLIDKLPIQTRKKILIFALAILMVIILGLWLVFLQSSLAPSAQSEKQAEDLKKIQEDLTNFFEGTKEQFEILDKNLKDWSGESADGLNLTPEAIAKIKTELLAGEKKKWQKYSSPDYQYQIQYPNQWSIDATKPEMVSLSQPASATATEALTVQVIKNQDLDFIKNFVTEFPAGCAKPQQTIINGNQTMELRCLKRVGEINRETENYFIEKNNNLYVLSFIKNEKDFNDTSIKIITTIEFN